jgi:hypothetical protein
LIEKKDVDKRVRSLTKLTKDHAVADLTADFFDSVHPLPEVCFLCSFVVEFYFLRLELLFAFLLIYLYTGSPFPCFTSSSSIGRAPSG